MKHLKGICTEGIVEVNTRFLRQSLFYYILSKETAAFRIMAGFHSGFCPYYCPATNEKNYKSDIADIEGARYLRRPFDVVWYPVIFVIVMILICSVVRGRLFTFSSFFVATMILSLCSLLISKTGNYIYKKIRGNKLVAILNKDGIYTPRLCLSWDKINRMKVHYALPKSARGTSYFIELEFVMKVEDAFHCTESVYIYYVPLKMRRHIRTYLKQRES